LKDIIKILEEAKKEIQESYDKATQQRQQTQTQLGNIATEMARLEGEHRRIEKLEKEFKTEPKSKSK